MTCTCMQISGMTTDISGLEEEEAMLRAGRITE